MGVSFKRALNAINEFVESKKFNEKVLGIIVFGSFAKGTLHKTSDIDVMLLMNGGRYVRKIEDHDGLKFEVCMVPIETFTPPLNGEGDLFFDMFRLQVLRTGKILYDREGLLSQLSFEAINRKIPNYYEKKMLNKAYKRLRSAEKYLWAGRLKHANFELQVASIDVARTLLLRIDEPEINIPRLLIPHLRRTYPDFYKVFREIHGLDHRGRADVEFKVASLLDHLRKIADKYGVVKAFRSVIKRAEHELLNAKDCLEHGDYDSATLQLKLSTFILNRYLPINHKFLCNMHDFGECHLTESPINIKEQLSTLRNTIAGHDFF